MKRFRFMAVLLFLTTTLFGTNFKVDLSHSYVGFKVKHLMISNVKGNFSDFDGSFSYDEKTKKLVALDGTIGVASINTDNEKRDKHLRSSDFFAVDSYPNITFKLTRVVGDKAYGKLTMRGVTKDIKLNLETSGIIKDPWGKTRMGVTLTGKINRYDYGIKYNKLLEAGGLTIGDIVKLEIELEGIKTK